MSGSAVSGTYTDRTSDSSVCLKGDRLKKQSVKLALHRETLRQLEARAELGRAQGGMVGDVSTDQAWACGTKLSAGAF